MNIMKRVILKAKLHPASLALFTTDPFLGSLFYLTAAMLKWSGHRPEFFGGSLLDPAVSRLKFLSRLPAFRRRGEFHHLHATQRFIELTQLGGLQCRVNADRGNFFYL